MVSDGRSLCINPDLVARVYSLFDHEKLLVSDRTYLSILALGRMSEKRLLRETPKAEEFLGCATIAAQGVVDYLEPWGAVSPHGTVAALDVFDLRMSAVERAMQGFALWCMEVERSWMRAQRHESVSDRWCAALDACELVFEHLFPRRGDQFRPTMKKALYSLGEPNTAEDVESALFEAHQQIFFPPPNDQRKGPGSALFVRSVDGALGPGRTQLRDALELGRGISRKARKAEREVRHSSLIEGEIAKRECQTVVEAADSLERVEWVRAWIGRELASSRAESARWHVLRTFEQVMSGDTPLSKVARESGKALSGLQRARAKVLSEIAKAIKET